MRRSSKRRKRRSESDWKVLQQVAECLELVFNSACIDIEAFSLEVANMLNMHPTHQVTYFWFDVVLPPFER